mgnify:FL=1
MNPLEEKTELEEKIEQEQKREKKKFWKGVLCGAAVTLCLAVGVGIFCTAIVSGIHIFSSSEKKQVENKLQIIQAIIDKYYLYEDEIDQDALEQGIYAGYVNALGDKYTVYYNEEETDALQESVSGTYTGIGAALLQNTTSNEVVISKVYKDSPAEEAGLKEGDVIYQVDDHTISDQSLDEVVSWIRGEEGTDVTLHVVRDGQQLELKATRKQLETPTVVYEMKENQVGYIAVNEFDEVTLSQFETALNDLEGQGMEGLIIDLRSNPGGNLDTVTDMLKLLLPKGTIVSVKDKAGNVEEYKSDGSHEFTKPFAVLVNQYSASASEIFSGAIQDYGIGDIVGVTTYGKGVVQQILDLGDGTAMKITIAEYFTPKGRSINKKGVTPDVEVEYQADENDPTADNQLEKAMEVVQQKMQSEK